jgi:uncharacterized protein (DUF1810 family)
MFAHFLTAQDPIYAGVLIELRAGKKTSHWMWFIFPQLRALGRSPTAKQFGLASLDDAQNYLAHPVLGARLRECTALVNAIEHRTIIEIFGSPDDIKFRSSMTLFAEATPDNQAFNEALEKYFDSDPDGLTLAML